MSNTPTPFPLPAGFEFVEQLGARVCLARGGGFERAVALKLCATPLTAECVRHLAHEAQIFDVLEHPHIVRRLAWLAPSKGSPAALVTEFAAGLSLAQRDGPTPARLGGEQLLALLAPLLDAVRSIHRAGYLHRDLTPHNVLLREDGSPLLLDFGAARRLDGSDAGNDLDDQATAGFAPPERYNGDAETPASDVYSLAAIAWGLSCGYYPPPAPERVAASTQAAASTAGTSDLIPPVDHPDPALVAALQRALALDPQRRPPDIEAFANAIGLPLEPILLHGALPATERIRRPRPSAAATEPNPTASTASTVAAASATPAGPAGASITAGRRPARLRGSLLLLFLASLGAAAWQWGPALYRSHIKSEWLVDASGRGDTRSIGAALRQARDHALIQVRSGHYPETLNITRPVVLSGIDGEVKIRPPDGPCLRFSASGGSISGLDLATAAPSPAALPAQASAPAATKAAANAPPTPACIELVSGNPVIEDNHIRGQAGPAIRMHRDSQARVRNNAISAPGGVGIIADGAGGTVISNDISETAGAGIALRAAASTAVSCNDIRATGQAGIVIGAGSTAAISDNRVQNATSSGIEIRTGATPDVIGNLIELSGQSGFYIHSGAGGQIDANWVVGSGYSGVAVAAGGTPQLLANHISDSDEHGILVVGDSQLQLRGNAIHNNYGYGVVVAPGSRLQQRGNRLTNNRDPQILLPKSP